MSCAGAKGVYAGLRWPHGFANAEWIAAGLSPLAPALQQAAAGRLLLREVQAHIRQGQGFALETTLAGRGYLRLVDQLHAAG